MVFQFVLKFSEYCETHEILLTPLPVIEVTADLEEAGVTVEGVVVEAHLTGYHDCHFDVKSDSLGAGDPQPGHLTQDVVLLKLLQAVDLQVGFPQQLQRLRVLCAHVDWTWKPE